MNKEKKHPIRKSRKRIATIKLEFDKDLQALSGTILFPQKQEAANKFFSKSL